MLDACLVGRLNLFLQGDTGSGKTQLAADAMQHFGDKSLFILGRNDMDTRELFQQLNLLFKIMNKAKVFIFGILEMEESRGSVRIPIGLT